MEVSSTISIVLFCAPGQRFQDSFKYILECFEYRDNDSYLLLLDITRLLRSHCTR